MWGVFYDADAPMKRVVIRRVFLGVFMDRFMDFTAHHHYAMSEGRVGGRGRGGGAVFKRLVFCLSSSCLGANFMFQSCKATSGSSDSAIGGTNSVLDSCEMGFKIRAFQDGSCRGEVGAWALHLLKTSTSDPLMFRSGIGSCLELRATSRELVNTQFWLVW